MNIIENKFLHLCNETSDINEHLPTLYKYATECESVFETGVRGVVSSWAFIHGLLNNKKSDKRIFLNDIDQCNIHELISSTQNLPIKIDYAWQNNLTLELSETFDLTFIDTWHIYGQLKRELEKFSKITNKYIIMHDTTVDEWLGETIRCQWDPNTQSIQSGFPVDEITKGLWPAIEEFLQSNQEWVLHERYYNNNGLTILKRINV
jgi:hypothetical protein